MIFLSGKLHLEDEKKSNGQATRRSWSRVRLRHGPEILDILRDKPSPAGDPLDGRPSRAPTNHRGHTICGRNTFLIATMVGQNRSRVVSKNEDILPAAVFWFYPCDSPPFCVGAHWASGSELIATGVFSVLSFLYFTSWYRLKSMETMQQHGWWWVEVFPYGKNIRAWNSI